jgi:hypothetical protein
VQALVLYEHIAATGFVAAYGSPLAIRGFSLNIPFSLYFFGRRKFVDIGADFFALPAAATSREID